MRVTLSVTLDRLEGPEQDPHRVVEQLIEELLAGRSLWVRHGLDTKFDVTEVELVNLRD